MALETTRFNSTTKSGTPAFERLVIGLLPISAIVAAIGIVFLILFFSGSGSFFGPLNDIAVVIQYSLMLPIMIYIHQLLPIGQNPGMKLIRSLGILATLAVIILQTMLVLKLLPFQRQIIMVIPAFLVVTAWFIYIEKAGSEIPQLPKGRMQAILAGLVFGYPFWALNFQKRIAVSASEHSDSKEESA